MPSCGFICNSIAIVIYRYIWATGKLTLETDVAYIHAWMTGALIFLVLRLYLCTLTYIQNTLLNQNQTY